MYINRMIIGGITRERISSWGSATASIMVEMAMDVVIIKNISFNKICMSKFLLSRLLMGGHNFPVSLLVTQWLPFTAIPC